MQLVENGAHKCSKKSESNVDEEKTASEDHTASKLEENLTTSQVSPISEEVPATKASKHEDPIPVVDNKTAQKKVDETDPMATSEEFVTVMKRMTELEQKMTNINHQPVVMPPEKEEMLHNTINRADLLEKELLATKKALEDSLVKQEEISAYVEQKKQNRRKCFCFW